jgi:hypothetical protein
MHVHILQDEDAAEDPNAMTQVQNALAKLMNKKVSKPQAALMHDYVL